MKRRFDDEEEEEEIALNRRNPRLDLTLGMAGSPVWRPSYSSGEFLMLDI